MLHFVLEIKDQIDIPINVLIFFQNKYLSYSSTGCLVLAFLTEAKFAVIQKEEWIKNHEEFWDSGEKNI